MTRPTGAAIRVRGAARGFSLAELLIVSVMVLFIGGAVYISSLIATRWYVSSNASVYVQGEARRALDVMAEELRKSGGAVDATVANQLTFQLALGYDLPPPCPPGAVCWGARDQGGLDQPAWSVRYRLGGNNGNQLLREILNAGGAVQPGTRVLANELNLLNFTFVADPTNTVTITLQAQQTSQQLPGGSVQASPTPLVMQVRLRNL